ncbi:hypothetical protein FALBO_15113 [Fusarium albosuccineum]|uniref:Uncharacterized protein n=1 Tax=Fusarium albosuccineum TaxID=1237068 RepID=A0A8H4KUT1_9HYPO|nr:hypothetical protein FALBO_15113 [Fusarium albosuccineum]
MRFYTIAALLMSATALAAPANEKPYTCCCCDISQPAMVCREKATDDCICTKVMCPADAPVVWADAPEAEPTTPVKRDDEAEVKPKTEPEPELEPGVKPCCCCDIRINKIVCQVRPKEEDQSCMCLAVMCPEGAPTTTTCLAAKETGN